MKLQNMAYGTASSESLKDSQLESSAFKHQQHNSTWEHKSDLDNLNKLPAAISIQKTSFIVLIHKLYFFILKI